MKMTTKMTMRPLRAVSMIVWLAAAGAACADDAAITPYRPSVSSPAQLPATGQLEFESGFLSSEGQGQHRTSLPYLFKLAWSEQWGILLGGEAFVTQGDAGAGHARGVGDTTVTLKRAFPIDDATALGLELGAKLPTAGAVIGSGKTDYTLNTIFSKDFGSLHLDANAGISALGAHDAGSAAHQTALSAAFSFPVAAHWGLDAEVSQTRQAGEPGAAQVLLAAAYSPSKQITIDLGFAHHLSGDAPKWSWFGGAVVALGQMR